MGCTVMTKRQRKTLQSMRPCEEESNVSYSFEIDASSSTALFELFFSRLNPDPNHLVSAYDTITAEGTNISRT